MYGGAIDQLRLSGCLGLLVPSYLTSGGNGSVTAKKTKTSSLSRFCITATVECPPATRNVYLTNARNPLSLDLVSSKTMTMRDLAYLCPLFLDGTR
jgi:hypothetical protein